jgi:Phosphotransferase enzyme family
LHTENIAFDPIEKQLDGIFDFGDACIVDIHFEFAPIYKFSTELLENIVHKYETLAKVKLSLRKIVLRDRMNELGDLVEYIDRPDSEIYQKAIRRMRQWIKEKDIYKHPQLI